MTAHDLLTRPAWRPEDLGMPLPDCTHAVSMVLPRWEDVVGYEEKRASVMSRLRCGYPRFMIHPLVAELAHRISEDAACLPFPSRDAALACARFVDQVTGEESRVAEHGGVFGVISSAKGGEDALKAFWQHTGLIVSTRRAEAVLKGWIVDDENGATARERLRGRLAELYECGVEDIHLAPTGMAAQFAALRAVMSRRPGCPTAQLGFCYVDTLKLQQKFGSGATLLHDLGAIGHDLEDLMARQELAACFSEIPGNPLLGSVDLRVVSPLLRRRGVPLIGDDVVATPINVDLRPFADLIATSLTKYIAGTCDVMGGAVICNPRSPMYKELHPLVRRQHEEMIWGEDAEVLDANARTFPERMARHNENGLFIAERLKSHPAVERVWYPKWEDREAYEAVRRPDGGWGSLVTFLPRDAERSSPRIYDRLELCKGPSLGTIFTLACPFTLLAHYTELDWAESCGVSRHLIRISVGLEEPEEIWQRVERALAAGNRA